MVWADGRQQEDLEGRRKEAGVFVPQPLLTWDDISRNDHVPWSQDELKEWMGRFYVICENTIRLIKFNIIFIYQSIMSNGYSLFRMVSCIGN